MLRIVLFRVIVFALPFAAYFLWREIARRTGREMGSTPWGWLIASGAVLAGLSLALSVGFFQGHGADTYIPAKAQPDGSVVAGHYEPPKK